MIEALDIRVRGIVQGVGFRPFVYRLARRYLVSGWVLNDLDGVFIHAEAEPQLLDGFVNELHMNPPAAAKIAEVELVEVPLEDCVGFEIRESESASVEKATLISADLGICADCARELLDPSDRRYRYPFINCTNCGPRFTIIDRLPYDRPSTSMRAFEMCAACAAEYSDPNDRRFHAQPDACFDCGPALSFFGKMPPALGLGCGRGDDGVSARGGDPASAEGDDGALNWEDVPPLIQDGERGAPVGRASGKSSGDSPLGASGASVVRPGGCLLPAEASGIFWGRDRAGSDAILAACCALLAAGGILAVKGLGGFHLVCDAGNPQVIAELRRRKRRDGKALAVLVEHVEAARAVCEVSAEEAALLESPARPIVLLRKKPGVELAAGLADGLPELGVMLPSTPVQTLLIHDFTAAHGGAMLVMTSGNVHDEPIVTDDGEAREKLLGIADAIIGNDREILARYDDSVARVLDLAGTPAVQLIRRARGYAPVPLPLKQPIDPEGINHNPPAHRADAENCPQATSAGSLQPPGRADDPEGGVGASASPARQAGAAGFSQARDVDSPAPPDPRGRLGDDGMELAPSAYEEPAGPEGGVGASAFPAHRTDAENRPRAASAGSPQPPGRVGSPEGGVGASAFPAHRADAGGVSRARGAVFAAGSEQKSTFCYLREGEAFVSQHIGDREDADVSDAWHTAKERFEKLFELEPRVLACDAHPEYIASKWAREQAIREGLPLVEVQHHHAHIAAVLGEHGLYGPCCGIALDGTGYGADGAIWGGEVLLANQADYERFANFTYVPMPGATAAIKHPLRMAYGVLWAYDLLEHPGARRMLDALGDAAAVCGQMIENGLNTPYTSSAGRLFDAVSALLGVCEEPSYEGEAAILLDAARPPAGAVVADDVRERYAVSLTKNAATDASTAHDTSVVLLDAEPTVRAVLDDMVAGVEVSQISLRFHDAIVGTVVAVAELVRALYGIELVALSGGCFMNRYLVERCVAELGERGFTVALNASLPPNDGCIAFGQAIVGRFGA